MNRLIEKFRRDLLGMLFLAVGLFVGLSLLSFHPEDPSFNSIGQGLKVLNWCGVVGSFLADLLFQLWGFAAWLLIPGFLRLSYLAFRGKELSIKNLKLLWGSLLILVFSCLLGTYFPENRIYSGQILVGGLLGTHLSGGLMNVFNLVGVQIVLWSMALVLIVFFSEKTLAELTEAPRLWFLRGWKNFDAGALWKSLWKPLPAQKSESLKEKTTKAKPIQAPAVADKAPSQPSEMPIVFDPGPQAAMDFSKDEEAEERPAALVAKRKVTMKTKVPQRVENWDLPKLSLVEDPPVSRIKIDQGEIKDKARVLLEKLGLFDIQGEVVAAKPGPAVTMFEFRPESSVKISKITELEDDLSMALASESLRILAPIPGRDVVGIETSNRHRETVYMKDMLAEEKFWSDELTLPVALGRKVDGQPEIVDLRKMPHLMVAGTTGSGKSVFTVSAITGLIYRHSPKTLRLILIDPKQVDLAVFEKIPHLALPVVTDSHKAVLSLKWAVREMEKRYKSMSKFGARKLEEYNDKVSTLTKEQIDEHEKANFELEGTPGKKSEMYYYQPLPYFVIVVEEFADLMTVDKGNVEQSVIRLAQKARAAGIHLILCLQSPRKEFVTGAIKSNIPGRIAFKAASSMESRIILDDVGAERLLATGDMLYRGPGSSAIVRHHGPFLNDADIAAVTGFWAKQGDPVFDQNALSALESDGATGIDGDSAGGDEPHDDRYDEILNWVQAQKEVSASLIQRRFQLGYPRAARMIETFERGGIVGPANGSKPRQVLIHNLNNLGV
jgi:S-DNA-T family DNA segregation ATPase FtsK/SpoIIIE